MACGSSQHYERPHADCGIYLTGCGRKNHVFPKSHNAEQNRFDRRCWQKPRSNTEKSIEQENRREDHGGSATQYISGKYSKENLACTNGF